MRPRLQDADIFRRHGNAYRSAHGPHRGRVERRIMGAIEALRAAAPGGHINARDARAHDRDQQRPGLPKNRPCGEGPSTQDNTLERAYRVPAQSKRSRCRATACLLGEWDDEQFRSSVETHEFGGVSDGRRKLPPSGLATPRSLGGWRLQLPALDRIRPRRRGR